MVSGDINLYVIVCQITYLFSKVWYNKLMSKIISTTIRIDEELMDELKKMKQKTGMPISEFIRRAIVHYLRELRKLNENLHSTK